MRITLFLYAALTASAALGWWFAGPQGVLIGLGIFALTALALVHWLCATDEYTPHL